MAKQTSKYVCQQCGYSQVGWAGKCPSCNTWGSLVETIIKATNTGRGSLNEQIVSPGETLNLSKLVGRKTSRISTRITELDRVLGGGLVEGQVVLVAGEPGIGKSTILLQIAQTMGKVLYAAGEESAQQIKIRADRLGVKNAFIEVLESTDTDEIISTAGAISGLQAVIVDSIQTMQTAALSGMAGSVGQIRESTFRLVRMAKTSRVPLFIVGQVTKEGTVAGPATLAHLVDTVIWFEGDKSLTLRLVRAFKNRFGPTDEVGIFSMEEAGLIGVEDANKLFLSDNAKPSTGSVVTSVMQGTRPILVEIQALVVSTKLPIPRRVAQGVDSKRLELLLAVLQRRAGLPLYDYDCFVNVAAGMNVREPGADLAICLAIASSFYDKAVARNTVAVGEVGLLGDIRPVAGQEKRVKESKRLGYKQPVTNEQVQYLNQAIKEYVKGRVSD